MGKHVILRLFLTMRSGTINFLWLHELWQYFPPISCRKFPLDCELCFSSISNQIKTHIDTVHFCFYTLHNVLLYHLEQ